MPRSNLSKVFGSRRSQSGSNGQSPPVVPHPQPFPNSATRFPNARDREGKVIPLVAAGHIRPKPLPDELTRTLSGIAEPHARVEAASDYMLSEITRACQLEDVAAAIGVSSGTLIQTITSRPSVAMCFAIALEASSHLLDNLARDIMDGTTPVEGPAARNPKILANYAISFRASAESRRRLSEGIIRRSAILGDDLVLRRRDSLAARKQVRQQQASEAEKQRLIERAAEFDQIAGIPPAPSADQIGEGLNALSPAEAAALSEGTKYLYASYQQSDFLDEATELLLSTRDRWRAEAEQALRTKSAEYDAKWKAACKAHKASKFQHHAKHSTTLPADTEPPALPNLASPTPRRSAKPKKAKI